MLVTISGRAENNCQSDKLLNCQNDVAIIQHMFKGRQFRPMRGFGKTMFTPAVKRSLQEARDNIKDRLDSEDDKVPKTFAKTLALDTIRIVSNESDT